MVVNDKVYDSKILNNIILIPLWNASANNSILECMAIGKPVIANDGEGVGTKELIDDTVNGYLVPPKCPDIFADRIMHLLDKQEVRNKMGEHGKKTIQEKFNLKKMVDSFSELFENYNLKRD